MSNRKRAGSLILLSLVIAFVTAAATMHGRGQNTSTAQDEPTPVQRGMLTQKQREHGKLFKNTGVGNVHDLIQKRAAEGDAGDILIESLPGTPELSRTGEAATDRLVTSAAQADAVVIGIVSGKTSQLNEAETFVFTDYAVNVVEVLKNNGAAPISENGTVTVTRPGGGQYKSKGASYAPLTGLSSLSRSAVNTSFFSDFYPPPAHTSLPRGRAALSWKGAKS